MSEARAPMPGERAWRLFRRAQNRDSDRGSRDLRERTTDTDDSQGLGSCTASRNATIKQPLRRRSAIVRAYGWWDQTTENPHVMGVAPTVYAESVGVVTTWAIPRGA